MGVRFSTNRARIKRKTPVTNYRKVDRYEEEGEIKINWFKWIGSFLLVLFLLFTYRVDYPYAQVARGWVEQSLTREYNFQGVYDWYQEKFSGNPAILTTFSIKQKESEPQYGKPIAKQAKEIKPLSQGVVIELNGPEDIKTVEQGLVISIKQEQNLGQTIVVRHKNGVESIYGMLDQINVEESDWVQVGQSIGISNNSLFFAIRDQSKYVNPMDVIAFESQN